jgi:hypothetical protein
MKNAITYLAFAALFFAAGPLVHECHAMGARNGAVQQRDEGSRAEDRKDRTPEDVSSEKKKGAPEKEQAPPQKKPRLKYRDQSKCPC